MVYDNTGIMREDIYDNAGVETFLAYDEYARKVHEKYLEGRLLIFEDDFDGNELNPNNWICESGHPRGPSYEGHRRGNISVRDSMLVVSGRKEDFYGNTWSVGCVISKGKKKFTHGRFEAKIKCSEILNSAFWLLGANHAINYTEDDGSVDYPTQLDGSGQLPWPTCGEIDIMESIDYQQKTKPQCNLWTCTTPVTSLGVGEWPAAIDTVNEWHVYALEKTPDYMAAFIDGVEYKRWTYANMNPDYISGYPDKPFDIMLSLGITSESDLTRGITETNMYVDWVRVYAPEGVIEPVKDTSIAAAVTDVDLKLGWKMFIPTEILPLSTSDMDVKWISDDESVVECGTGFDYGFVFGKKLGETYIHAVTSNRNLATVHVAVVSSDL